jgi:hypothetical protein
MHTQILKRMFCLILPLFLVVAIAISAIDLGLRNSTTPQGIVSFELCAFTSSCDLALNHWGAKGQALAMLSLGIDYLFLILYPGLLCIGFLLLLARLPPGMARVTLWMAWFCPVISVADAIENYALIKIILNESGNGYGLLAGIFAVIKFAFLGVTLAWLLFVSVRYVFWVRSKA